MQFCVASQCVNMSLKSIVSELKGINNRISKLCSGSKSVAIDVTPTEPIQQGQWASLPPELLSDIIRRLEESETSWPERTVLIFCASVCKSWRSATKEIIKTPQQRGQITFPISLKLVRNSSPTFFSNPKFSSHSCYFYVIFPCMNSPVLACMQCDALSRGTKKLLHSCCT